MKALDQSNSNNLTLGEIMKTSVIEQYRSQNADRDALFYLKPDSFDIFLMDFKQNRFVKEQVTGVKIPYKCSSIMTSVGKIYLIGGYAMEQGYSEPQILRQCVQLDVDL